VHVPVESPRLAPAPDAVHQHRLVHLRSSHFALFVPHPHTQRDSCRGTDSAPEIVVHDPLLYLLLLCMQVQSTVFSAAKDTTIHPLYAQCTQLAPFHCHFALGEDNTSETLHTQNCTVAPEVEQYRACAILPEAALDLFIDAK